MHDEDDVLRSAGALAEEVESVGAAWAGGDRRLDLQRLAALSDRAGALFPRLPASGDGLRLLGRLHGALCSLGPAFEHLQAEHAAQSREGRLPDPL